MLHDLCLQEIASTPQSSWLKHLWSLRASGTWQALSTCWSPWIGFKVVAGQTCKDIALAFLLCVWTCTIKIFIQLFVLAIIVNATLIAEKASLKIQVGIYFLFQEKLSYRETRQRKPWKKSSWLECKSLAASHAKNLKLGEGDPQLWIYSSDQPKMNHQKEGINTCIYKNEKSNVNIICISFTMVWGRKENITKVMLRFCKKEAMLMILHLHCCYISNASKTTFHFGVQIKRVDN